MRDPHKLARRWFKQAQHDGRVAQRHVREGDYSDACFMAEQTAQKALKAYLYGQGARSLPEHSVAKLAEQAQQHDATFRALIALGNVLDQYYIPTRYPDAIADPAIPFETYTQTQAEEAIRLAEQILTTVQQQLGSPS